MKGFLVLIYLCLIVLQHICADSGLTISYIKEISEALKNADQDTLVLFDVDNIISAPRDLIGDRKRNRLDERFSNFIKISKT
jgi:hypothetical protein